MVVIDKEYQHPIRREPAFSLIEMAAVIALLVILMAAAASLVNGAGSRSRKAATDTLSGMIEQAHTAALSSRSNVVLAVAEPGDLPEGGERCRLGLFKVETWPDSLENPLSGALMGRWRTLESGVALIGGAVDDVPNPMDGPELTIAYGGGQPRTVKIHAIAFNSRGGLRYPSGSAPVAMRVAEGNYRGGKATPLQHGEDKTITENRLKIGRVTARPYRIDG